MSDTNRYNNALEVMRDRGLNPAERAKAMAELSTQKVDRMACKSEVEREAPLNTPKWQKEQAIQECTASKANNRAKGHW